MDQKAIETLAVNEIRNHVALSEYLDQCIADNDKEPSFDGFVYLYSKNGKKKTDLMGRIAVQIKGTAQRPKSQKNDFKYPVEISDLRNYLSEGGVMFFLVDVSHGLAEKEVYYNDLLPVKIRKYLSDTKEHQHRRTIPLKRLASSTKDLEDLFRSFYEHS